MKLRTRVFLGLALGLLSGLLIGWLVLPLEYVDTDPSSLRSDFRTDYVLMTAAAYAGEGDIGLAQVRLAALGPQPPSEIVAQAASKKAENIVLLDMGPTSAVTDWFVICQGDNPIHTRAIADAVLTGLKQRKTYPWLTEGAAEARWILIDYVDVVVHVMTSQAREYYALEKLWADAPRTRIASE